METALVVLIYAVAIAVTGPCIIIGIVALFLGLTWIAAIVLDLLDSLYFRIKNFFRS
jgi:hypothetical protein